MQQDLSDTALVVIDLQRGIVAMDTTPYPTAPVVANCVRLVDAWRAASKPVCLVHVDFLGPDILRPETDVPAMQAPPAGWADFVPELGVSDSDIVITKRQWGAFHGTELDLQLRRRGIRRIVLCGIATSVGVESTARGAYELGYHQIFAEDAMTSRTAEEHRSSVNNIFPRIGRVRSTDEILAMLADA